LGINIFQLTAFVLFWFLQIERPILYQGQVVFAELQRICGCHADAMQISLFCMAG